MTFQPDPDLIRWRLALHSPPDAVFAMLATAAGRARFWAESATEHAGIIHFIFPGHLTWHARILTNDPPRQFALVYYGGSTCTFTLTATEEGGTELLLEDRGVRRADRIEVIAGWVSVLLALKAAVDYGVDLRSHHPHKHWQQGYVEN